jgi:hypothetical protein
MMKAEHFSALKEKILGAENFNEPWEYFFDHFSENPAFMNMGKKTQSPFLQSILEEVGERLFRQKVKVTNMMLTEIPQHHFVHGACFVQNRLASVMYFEDAKVGMLSILGSAQKHEVSMIRFTGIELHGKGPFMIDFPKDKIVH